MKYFFFVLIWTLQVRKNVVVAKCTENYNSLSQPWSRVRGNYQDVASEKNGAIISTARINNFLFAGDVASPLRDNFYYYTNLSYYVGHIYVDLHISIIIELLQTYELNRVRIRLWDEDNRFGDFQVFVVGSDRITETEIFNGLASSVKEIEFPDQFVSKIRFYNKNGTTYTGHKLFSIIKIQAYYQF